MSQLGAAQVAFGATILVPTLFAFIACAYAVSTLTDNWQIIIPVAAAWGFIILTIDRALLATYRSFQSFRRKLSQFSLRMLVAGLMGITPPTTNASRKPTKPNSSSRTLPLANSIPAPTSIPRRGHRWRTSSKSPPDR